MPGAATGRPDPLPGAGLRGRRTGGPASGAAGGAGMDPGEAGSDVGLQPAGQGQRGDHGAADAAAGHRRLRRPGQRRQGPRLGLGAARCFAVRCRRWWSARAHHDQAGGSPRWERRPLRDGPQALRVEDFDRRSVVALKKPKELPGNSLLQASPDVAEALALGRAPSGIGARVGVVAEPGHHHGVERPVELAVTGAVQPVAGDLPGGRRDRAGSGQGSERRLRPQPPACDQLTRTWAALIGPTPGNSSSHGATPATSRSSSARSPAASTASSWTRRAVERNARTVMRCSSDLEGRSRNLAQRAIWPLVASPRSSARNSSGAPTIRALSWLTALTLAAQALWRVASRNDPGCRGETLSVRS